jgi:hypothetical protein
MRKKRSRSRRVEDDPEREDVTTWRDVSAPSVIGNVELRAEKGDRLLLLTMYGLAEGRALYDELVGDQRVTWKGDETVHAGKCIVTSDRLEEIVEYDGSVPTLPEPYVSYVERLYGQKGQVLNSDIAIGSVREDRKRIAVPPPGATTLATICKEMGIEGRVARAELRQRKVAKPYAWADDAPIRAMLKKIR